jgi:MarR family transcriptional regulator, transcriptional regulator for hemolysin
MNTILIESLPFGRSLVILAKTYYGALAKRLEHLEIERHYSILIFIEGATHGCTQQCICDCMKIDKVSMVGILDYLIKKKYIKKTVNQADRREHFIQLSEKAKKILPEIHQAIESLNNEAFKGIPRDKQKEFYQYIYQMQTNLDPLPSQKIYINYKKAVKEHKK